MPSQVAAHARGLPLALLALLWLASVCDADSRQARAGPPHPRATRLIVRYKDGFVAAAAAGTGGMRPVAPRLNMFTLEVEDGSTLEGKAKQMTGMSNVLYAEPDEWVSVAGRSSQQSAGHANTWLRRATLPSPPQRPPPRSPPPPRPRRQPPPLSRRPPPPVRRSPPPPRPRSPPPPSPRPPPLRPPPSPPAPGLTPNDLFYSQQWGMGMIKATEAWSVISDASSALVCIVDSGVKWDHPDLVANLVPQTKAYKLANTDDYGHGTHVAGIIGAVGNNGMGVAGTALKASMLVCKALNSLGSGAVSDVVRCIDYCRSKGARIINTSFSMPYVSLALQDSFRASTQAGVFFSSAAGNYGENNDEYPEYPASFKFPGSVAVANIGPDGTLAPNTGEGWLAWGGSNYGKASVHLAAPGQMILSTWFERDYAHRHLAFENGTSMAAPAVSGAAALALAASGGKLTNVQLQRLLVATARRLPALRGKLVSGGVLDLHKLVLAAAAAGQASPANKTLTAG